MPRHRYAESLLPPRPAAQDEARIERFVDAVWLEQGLSAQTQSAYRSDLGLLARWLLGRNLSLVRASEADLKAYFAWRAREPDGWPFAARTQARLLSSQWCRCLETAREMNVGVVEPWSPLNSFFGNRGDGYSATRQTIEGVNALPAGAPVILVSHQVNITRLTGVFPSSNEGVIISLPLSEEPHILGRVSPDLP